MKDTLDKINEMCDVIIAEYNAIENYLWIHAFNELTKATLAIEGKFVNGELVCNDCSQGINKPCYPMYDIHSIEGVRKYVDDWSYCQDESFLQAL